LFGLQIWLWLLMFWAITLKLLNSCNTIDMLRCLEVTHQITVLSTSWNNNSSRTYMYIHVLTTVPNALARFDSWLRQELLCFAWLMRFFGSTCHAILKKFFGNVISFSTLKAADLQNILENQIFQNISSNTYNSY